MHRWLIALGLVLVVVGAKLWLVDAAGSSVPYRDQIDAEGESVLRPWVDGELKIAAFFAAHNEHRVVLTKLLSWASVALNGQWDVLVQLCLNALLHAGLLLVVLAWLGSQVSGWPRWGLSVIAVLMWVIPLDWENTLGGFQSQVYLVLALSFWHLWGVLTADRPTLGWWSGNLAGGLALGAMASGVFSSIAIVVVLTLQSLADRQFPRHRIVTLTLCMMGIGAAGVMRVTVEGHEVLKAQNPMEFFSALAEIMVWPLSAALPWAAIVALPGLIWAGRLIRHRRYAPTDRVWLGVFVWLSIAALATAYLRGHGSPLVSRYLTTYHLLVIAQGVALAQAAPNRWRPWALGIWAGAVAAFLVVGGLRVVERRLPQIDERNQRMTAIVRAYLQQSNPAVFQQAVAADLPYPDGNVLATRWQHAGMQDLMPAAVRRPLVVGPPDTSAATGLPPAPYPVIAVSPITPQYEPWIWRSERLPASTLPVLRFRFLGALGDPESALRLRIVTDLQSVDVIPDGPARHRWKTINVIRPPGEWWIEIRDNDSVDRITLTAPVEMGLLSWAAEKAIKHYPWWISMGLVLSAIGVGWRLSSSWFDPAQMMRPPPIKG